MSGRLLSGLAVGAVLLSAAGTAFSANTVRIQSKEVPANAGEVVVGVYITNDRDVTTIVLPLELRADTPGRPFIDSFALTARGRIGGSGLVDLEVKRLCGSASPDNRCGGPTSHTWSCAEDPDTPLEFFTSPSAAMWVGLCLTGAPLAPGRDAAGDPSVTLTFGLPLALGSFVIDTCCMTPANHLTFGIIPAAGEPGTVVTPSFIGGVVTAVPPQDMARPVAVCRDALISLNGAETVSVTAQDIDGGSYDVDSDSLIYTAQPPGPFPAGTHLLQLMVDDGLLADTCTATVTVVTNRPPVALCRDFRLRRGQRCGPLVYTTDIDAGSFDPDDDPLTLTLEPDDAYPTGVTLARLIVSDGLFADTCEATVTIENNAVIPFSCPMAVGPEYDEHLQPRTPNIIPLISLCPGTGEMTFTQSPPVGWFLSPGLDSITVTGTTEGGRVYTCRVPIESPDEAPPGSPPLPLSIVNVDILPLMCPNTLSLECDEGYVPLLDVAVLGSADFQVTSIGPSTARLSGVPMQGWYMQDVGAPVRRDPTRPCACNEIGGDGHPDMILRFDVCEVIAAAGLDTADGRLPLVFTATSTSGGSVTGGDCLRYYRPGQEPDPDSVDALPGAILPLENYPNPFNSGTVIHYGLGRGGTVLLEVFNILGQRVRTLTAGPRESGPQQVSWNGRDDSGRPLASGLYLCRLSAPDRREVRKMLLLR